MRISDWSSDVCSSDLALLGASAAGAQLLPGGGLGRALPGSVGQVLDRVSRTGNDAVDSATRDAGRIGEPARKLADTRIGRLRALVRAHPDLLEINDVGPPLLAELLPLAPHPAP